MSFLSDVKSIEDQVRKWLEDGPVTPYYELDLERIPPAQCGAGLGDRVRAALQAALLHDDVHPQETLQALFKEHWEDKQDHANRLAERIKQLGGVPNFAPEGIAQRAFSHFESGHTLADLLKEDLLAERVVIRIYNQMVEYFGTKDPTTRRIFEELLADEEDHADELADLLYTVDPETGKAVEQFTSDGTTAALQDAK